MALIVDEQSSFKHFCKICKKGFMCGRALGGHMRAHGIGDENKGFDDDDYEDEQVSDWEDKSIDGEGDAPPSNKRMYALRTNPNRLRNCRVCENCGKEFESWKCFLEHGKCNNNSDDGESLIVSSPGSEELEEGEDNGDERKTYGWAKRKRSYRTTDTTIVTSSPDPTLTEKSSFKTSVPLNNGFNSNTTICPTSEEEDLANCLMMLSNATVYPYFVRDQSEESSSKEDERRILPISYNISPTIARSSHIDNNMSKSVVVGGNVPKGKFECKACKKVFNSHQALGGHRASHKKVKGCFAAKLDKFDQGDEDHNNMLPSDHELMKQSKLSTTSLLDQRGSNISTPMSKKKTRVHECSICHRVFNSGQALGGHKRCHWITPNTPDPSTLVRFQELRQQIEQVQEVPTMFTPSNPALDLNIPASNDRNNMIGIRRDPQNPLSFEVPTNIFLQSWGGVSVEMKHEQHQQKQVINNDNDQDNNRGEKKINNETTINCESNVANNEDDEANSKVKLAKLCELKEHMNTNGSSSPWLQVGIGSS